MGPTLLNGTLRQPLWLFLGLYGTYGIPLSQQESTTEQNNGFEKKCYLTITSHHGAAKQQSYAGTTVRLQPSRQHPVRPSFFASLVSQHQGKADGIGQQPVLLLSKQVLCQRKDTFSRTRRRQHKSCKLTGFPPNSEVGITTAVIGLAGTVVAARVLSLVALSVEEGPVMPCCDGR